MRERWFRLPDHFSASYPGHGVVRQYCMITSANLVTYAHVARISYIIYDSAFLAGECPATQFRQANIPLERRDCNHGYQISNQAARLTQCWNHPSWVHTLA